MYDRDYKELIERLNKYNKRMVVVGQMNLIYLFEKKYVKPLYKHFAWLTEHLGNQTIPGIPIKNFDAAVYSMTPERQEDMAPEILITYGGHIVSKQLKKYLRNHPRANTGMLPPTEDSRFIRLPDHRHRDGSV